MSLLMRWLPLPAPHMLRNPITQAEFRHQRHVLRTSRAGWFWIGLALMMVVPALLAALYYSVMAMLDAPFIEIDNNVLDFIANYASLMLLTLNVALSVVVSIITMALAGQSIRREKQNRTWDTLLLTNIDARTLVWGKWWASLRAVWGDHAMVGAMRVGLAGWLLVLFQSLPSAVFDLPLGPGYFLPLALVALAYTVVDAGFSAALGLLVPLADDLPGSVTSTLVIAVRVVSLFILLILVTEVFIDVQNRGGLDFLQPALIGLAVLLGLTWAALWLAEWLALRGQVSPVEAKA